MNDHRRTLGKAGEDHAVRYLESNAYVVLKRNWSSVHGEIDIIARDADELVFIEVKTGTTDSYGAPEDRVDGKKQQKLTDLASLYFSENEWEGDCRFDVIAVTLLKGRFFINHIKDAFRGEM